MTKPRKLAKGDRVKITGPWSGSWCGREYIGKFATVNYDDGGSTMSININIDGLRDSFFWDRESLRALPRKVQR